MGVGGMRREPADDLHIASIEFCWGFEMDVLPVGDPSTLRKLPAVSVQSSASGKPIWRK